jgi:hypothetical protein
MNASLPILGLLSLLGAVVFKTAHISGFRRHRRIRRIAHIAPQIAPRRRWPRAARET